MSIGRGKGDSVKEFREMWEGKTVEEICRQIEEAKRKGDKDKRFQRAYQDLPDKIQEKVDKQITQLIQKRRNNESVFGQDIALNNE